MQAIETRYHGPTNTRRSRISARCEAGRISIPYPHELNNEEGHDLAARTLILKLGWNDGRGHWVRGTVSAKSRGNVYVLDSKKLNTRLDLGIAPREG